MSEQASGVSVVRAGLLCRCPRCGKGPLFRKLLMLRETCSNCGLGYAFIDTGDGPAIFAIFILGFLALGGTMIAHLKYELPLSIVYPVLFVMTPVVAVALLRFLKATLIALQFKHKAEEGRIARR